MAIARFCLVICFFFLTIAGKPVFLFAEDLKDKKEENPLLSSPEIPFLEIKFKPKGPLIQTTVIAFNLRGKLHYGQINLPDFDIVITPENKRLIPLLRLLRILEASGSVDEKKAVFKTETSPKVTLDLIKRVLILEGNEIPVIIQAGISDLTGEGEIYIPEGAFKDVFKLDFEWSETEYAYNIKAPWELEIIKRRKEQSVSLLSADVQRIQEGLPETEPPAQPEKEKQPLSFLQADLKTNYRRSWSRNFNNYYVTNSPALTAWGSILNGDYELKFRNVIESPNTKLGGLSSWFDRGLWTSKNDNMLVNVGDTNIGLSELVAPSANIFGMSFKSFPKDEGNETVRDSFFTGGRPRFVSLGIFDGYAPLGATVDLWINNRLVESKAVEENAAAPLGYGYYKFEGIGLLDSALNEVKFVVKRPDGVTEEFYKEVMGTSQLLPEGQRAWAGGAGTNKRKEKGELKTEGEFAGLQMLYGLSDELTFGMTSAFQNKFAAYEGSFDEQYSAPLHYYLSPEVRYKFFRRFFLKANTAVSYAPDNQKSSYASIADLEYYMLKKAKLKAQVFSYDPEYSNGVTSVSDKMGYNLSFSWGFLKNWLLKNSLLHIRDNIKEKSAVTRQEDLFTTGLVIPNVIPKSTLQAQAGFSKGIDDYNKSFNKNMQALELETNLTKNLSINSLYTFGDNLAALSTNDLKFGIPITNLSSFYSYGSRVRANYRISSAQSVSGAYWASEGQDKVEFSYFYNYIGTGSHPWRSRFVTDRDLNNAKMSFKEYLDYDLDRRGNNKCGLSMKFDQSTQGYDFQFYVTLKELFLVRKKGLKPVLASGLSPRRGGIDGFVYLDLNDNGHREPEEPGVGGIDVLIDNKKAVSSRKDGSFYIPRSSNREFVSVSLNMQELPTIYAPTQGIQKAYWKEDAFTNVNLGVCVLNSISGAVKVESAEGEVTNVAGAKVILFAEDKETMIKDSITADDGSFYFGEIKTGNYFVSIDKSTILENYELKEPFQKVFVASGMEPVEVRDFDIYLKARKVQEVVKTQEPVIELKRKQSLLRTIFDKIISWLKFIFDKIIAWFEYIFDKVSTWFKFIYNKFIYWKPIWYIRLKVRYFIIPRVSKFFR